MKKIIFINAGIIVKDSRTGQWRTTNFKEKDRFGIMGDRLRVEAAAGLFKENPEHYIICATGKGQLADTPGILPVKKVIKKELIKLGIPGKKILTPGDASNTYQELKELKNFFSRNAGIKQVTIISNRWHIPRVKAIAGKKFNNFKNYQIILKYISAEDYLIKQNPGRWKKAISKAYLGKPMKKRIEIEKKGIEQILNGTYRFK